MFSLNEQRFLLALGNLQKALNETKSPYRGTVRNPLYKNNKKTSRSLNRNRTPKRTK